MAVLLLFLLLPHVVTILVAAAVAAQWWQRAVEDVAQLFKVLLRERLAAVPDRLGMEGQMVFD